MPTNQTTPALKLPKADSSPPPSGTVPSSLPPRPRRPAGKEQQPRQQQEAAVRQQQPSPAQPQDFFARNALTWSDRLACHDVAQALFPAHATAPHPWQGWCSYSVSLTPKRPAEAASPPLLLLQFRPPRHAIDAELLAAARDVYGATWVPGVVHAVGVVLWPDGAAAAAAAAAEAEAEAEAERRLEACAMTLLPGTPYGAVGAGARAPGWRREGVRGFAAFAAQGWVGGRVGVLEPPGPASLHGAAPGRLERLGRELPTEGLRAEAERVRGRFLGLGLQGGEGRRLLPFTVNHGDVVPGNILVDEESGRLTGLVDWAEAEVGVWGLSLYGLEFLLGFVSSSSREGEEQEQSSGVAWGAEGKGAGDGGKKFSFTYYNEAAELRALFWKEVKRRIGTPFEEPLVREAAGVIRDVGVLLWFGFAWDEGRINRVVNERDDPRELLLLETFLSLKADDDKDPEKAKL